MSAPERVHRICQCIGCGHVAIDDDVCLSCLRSPRRGRRWAKLSQRVRDDPVFALAVFRRIESARGRDLFLRAYGLPLGAFVGRGDA